MQYFVTFLKNLRNLRKRYYMNKNRNFVVNEQDVPHITRVFTNQN